MTLNIDSFTETKRILMGCNIIHLDLNVENKDILYVLTW